MSDALMSFSAYVGKCQSVIFGGRFGDFLSGSVERSLYSRRALVDLAGEAVW